MGLQRFPLSGFEGGLNLRDAPVKLEPNEAQDLLNVTLADVIGALKQRAGKTRFDSDDQGTVVDNLRAWYPTEPVKFLMASCGGNLIQYNALGSPSTILSGTSGTTWAFEQAEDVSNTRRLWCMNGVDAPQRINTSGVATAWSNTPPNGSILKLWRNRMVISGVPDRPQRVFFSDIGDPENPASEYGLNWVDIKGTEEDLDPITALEVFGDNLYVFKRKSIWAITNGNAPWDNERIATGLGCEGRLQTAILQGKMYFFNRTGIWSITSDLRVTEESDPVKALWDTRVNHSQLQKARLGVTPNNRIVCALALDGSEENNYVLELIPLLNFRRIGLRRSITLPSICLHDYPVGAFALFRPGDQDVLLGSESTSGKVHQLFNGTNDDGVAISSYWVGGWRSIVNEEPFERVRRINVEMQGRVQISLLQDFAMQAQFSETVETDSDPDPLWEGGTWDGGTWDPINSVDLKRVRPEQRGRYHAVRFSNTQLDKSFTIYAAEFAIRGGKEH